MFVITKQKNYLMNKKLGFDKEHVIYIPMQSNLTKSYDSFKEELLKNPMISSVTMKRGVPDSWYDGGNYAIRGMTLEESPNAERVWVGYDYFKTMGIKILQGRTFSSENRNDINDACLMNEKAVEALGLVDPIGQEIFFNDDRRIVIGVVANTNSKSLKEDYYPELYMLNQNNSGSGLIILANVQGQIDASLKAMEKLWYSYNPEDPFKYEFLDETYGRLYLSEQKMSQVFKVFAGIAIILSCLGILGLAIFEVQSRIKEIGIRKVNGSTSMSILILLCMRYVKIVVVAFVLACPISWYAMNNWLENFAYKISLSWWIFLLGGLFALTIAMLTVFWQSWRAANLNPVKTLRYE
jgi:putative ABC transport system permease protein